jgi:hypothetical protein
MERNAAGNLRSSRGLWRQGCKGTRGSVPKPGSMTLFIREVKRLRVLQPGADAPSEGFEALARLAGRAAWDAEQAAMRAAAEGKAA